MKEAADLFSDLKLSDSQKKIINTAGKVGRENDCTACRTDRP